MRVLPLKGDVPDLFLTHSPTNSKAACVGVNERTGKLVRVAFEATERRNLLVVGRSMDAAFGILCAMLLDLARQMITAPNWRQGSPTPPFGILDFVGTQESRLFTETAMSLPLSVKLERATDTVMTTLIDFEFELTRRRREPLAGHPPKFLFVCGLQSAHGIRSCGSYKSPNVNPSAARLAEILRSGPERSLHTVVWCNSFPNLKLSVTKGLDPFDHVILLDRYGGVPPHLRHAGSGDRAWLLDRRSDAATPLVPFAMPTEGWCIEAIRELSGERILHG